MTDPRIKEIFDLMEAHGSNEHISVDSTEVIQALNAAYNLGYLDGYADPAPFPELQEEPEPPVVGAWGSHDGTPLHLPSYRIGYDEACKERDQ